MVCIIYTTKYACHASWYYFPTGKERLQKNHTVSNFRPVFIYISQVFIVNISYYHGSFAGGITTTSLTHLSQNRPVSHHLLFELAYIFQKN